MKISRLSRFLALVYAKCMTCGSTDEAVEHMRIHL